MSYWSKHYYRVFFKIVKSKSLCDKIVSQHLLVDERLKPVTIQKHSQCYGPLWVGVLNNEKFVKAMFKFTKELNFDKAASFLNNLLLEASVNSLGFVDVHNVASVEKLSRIPSIESIVQELKARGFKASRTLFSNTGVKTNADEEAVKEVLGYEYVLPTHQGRGAEHLLAKVLVKPGSIIPMNYHFTTTKVHFELAGGKVLELYIDEALNTRSSHPFKGNMDVEKLKETIRKYGAENIAFVRMEATTNLIGGQPFSMENLREVSEICEKHGIKGKKIGKIVEKEDVKVKTSSGIISILI